MKVRLDFVPPSDPDIAKLHIYESVAEEGPYNEIEVVTVIGTYPNYITRYTTNLATAVDRWFAIAWETDQGIIGDMSAGLQGGTRTLVHEVFSRLMQRDATLNEAIAVQATEFVIAEYMKVLDPYDLTRESVTWRQLEGLTLMALARSSIQTFLMEGASGESYTAGLVSQKSDSSTKASLDNLIDYLTKEANRLLGIGNAWVFVLPDIDPTGLGGVSSISWDHSRLALTVNYE